MKKIFFILFFSYIGNIYSQEQSINPDLIAFPVSPEAARLGNYGSVPVNLCFGQLDKSIELFNGKVDDYNIPINISYNYAGFRVEETPSIVGLGWQLNIGGVVLREVRGYPDEHPNFGYYAANRNIIDTYFNEGTITDNNALAITNKKFDTEVDKYTVSVNGINFSFKIGLDGNPVFLSKHNYKMEVFRNPNNNLDIISFVLTDSNSNRYFFEERETNEPYGGLWGDTIYDDNFPRHTSSWQLKKIIANNNSEINYSYQDDDYYSYNYFATGCYKGAIQQEGAETTYNQGSTRELIKRKILTSITSKNFNVSFSILDSNGQKVYNKITVKDFNNKIVDYYDFMYSGPRNTLDKINRKNYFFYEFKYAGDIAHCQEFMNSLNQYPWNQDEWGFANGKFNNFAINMPYTQYNSDKTPSYFHTVLGALKTIKYPTGGETEFFYEQNTTGSTDAVDQEPNARINLKFKSDNIATAPEIKEQVFTKTFATDVIAELRHTIESTTQGFIEMSIVGTECNSVASNTIDQYYNNIPSQRAQQANLLPRICPRLYAALDDGCTSSYCTLNENSSGKFIMKAGTYELRFKTIQNRFKDVKASITLDFYDAGIAAFTLNNTNKKMGGVRVNKTVDSPVIGNEITTYYDYNDAEGKSVGNSYGNHLIKSIHYNERHTFLVIRSDGTFYIDENRFPVDEYNAKSYNLMLKRSSPVMYSGVKQYTAVENIFTPGRLLCNTCGGNFGGNYDGSTTYSYLGGEYGVTKTKYPEGYTRTGFDLIQKIPSFEYPFPQNGEDLSIGTMNRTEVFSKTDMSYNHKLLVDKKHTFSYSTVNVFNPAYIDPYANPNYPKSLKIGYIIKRTGVVEIHEEPSFNINEFYKFSVYKEVDSESFLTNINTKEFLNSTPIENNVAIEYDSYNQQHEFTTTDSNNIIKTNEIFHPYDFTDAVSQDMVNKNSIAPTVKVVNKKNNEIIESTKFNFSQISANLFKPVAYLKSKGSNTLEASINYNYDSQNGSIIAINKLSSPNPHDSVNDINTVIIWGYNKSQPIAKIQNATYSQVQSQVANLQALSNTGTESDLISALNGLRNSLPDSFVTTYTYKPLIGISSITDPKGDITTYQYDDLNRLVAIRDKRGNLLSENEYHFKN